MQRFWMEGPVAASLAASAAICAVAFADAQLPGAADLAIADLVELQATSFSHRSSGEFTQDGRVVTAPLVTVTIPHTLVIMRHQVTAAEYGRCVEAGACPMIDRGPAAADRPVVKVSWRDARAYAAWLSQETGEHYRLPTDEEWAHAAASRLQGRRPAGDERSGLAGVGDLCPRS